MIQLNFPEAAAIADLHLDDGGKRAEFSPHKDRLIRFLDYWDPRPLIILGDYMDQWRFRTSRILTVHADIHERVRRMKYWLTPGNHSPHMKPLRKIFEDRMAPTIIVNGWYCTHGDKADPMLDSLPERWMAKWMARLYWPNPITDPIYNYLMTYHRNNEPISRGLRKTGITPWAFGHSHVMGYFKSYYTGFAWANPGSCITNQMYFLRWQGPELTIEEWN